MYEVYCRTPNGRTGQPFAIKQHASFTRALFHLNACHSRYHGDGDVYGIALVSDPRADEGPCCTECSGPLDWEPKPGLCDACAANLDADES